MKWLVLYKKVNLRNVYFILLVRILYLQFKLPLFSAGLFWGSGTGSRTGCRHQGDPNRSHFRCKCANGPEPADNYHTVNTPAGPWSWSSSRSGDGAACPWIRSKLRVTWSQIGPAAGSLVYLSGNIRSFFSLPDLRWEFLPSFNTTGSYKYCWYYFENVCLPVGLVSVFLNTFFILILFRKFLTGSLFQIL